MQETLCSQVQIGLKKALLASLRGTAQHHAHAAVLLGTCQAALEAGLFECIHDLAANTIAPERRRVPHTSEVLLHAGDEARLLVALMGILDMTQHQDLCPALQSTALVVEFCFACLAIRSYEPLASAVGAACARAGTSIDTFEACMRAAYSIDNEPANDNQPAKRAVMY